MVKKMSSEKLAIFGAEKEKGHFYDLILFSEVIYCLIIEDGNFIVPNFCTVEINFQALPIAELWH